MIWKKCQVGGARGLWNTVQERGSVSSPLLPHRWSPTYRSSCHRKILLELCSSKAGLSSWKTVNLEIWPQPKIISSKRKWTLGDKGTTFIQVYWGTRQEEKWNRKYILLQQWPEWNTATFMLIEHISMQTMVGYKQQGVHLCVYLLCELLFINKQQMR